jgi:hypothetical protein
VGGWQVFGFIKETTSYGIEKMYLHYISPLSATHLWLHCSNFSNTSKKNYFICAANKKIGNRKSQRLISTPTYTWSWCNVIKKGNYSLFEFKFRISVNYSHIRNSFCPKCMKNYLLLSQQINTTSLKNCVQLMIHDGDTAASFPGVFEE